MGITGLLPFLKKIHVPVNISQYEGATVAVDVYCWLHKGAFSCAEKLAFGEETDQYIYYCMKYINYMLSKNLKPILVFDGCHLPSKKAVEDSRRERRKVNRQKAAQFLKEGRRSEAKECLQRSIDITPEMARKLIEVCHKRGVDCIVAPYEADAQLAYLAKSGIAQLVVTEDSDLLLFGCDKVIFKMDFFGNGILIEKSRLNEVIDIRDGFYTFDKFRHMCILSGCDYLSSLTGIGLVNAGKVFKLARQADLRQLLRKIPSYLNKSLNVPNEYIEGFIRAENTFLYQLVFDPLSRRLVPLNPYPEDIAPDDLKYAGTYVPQSEAFQVALGNIDLHSRQKMVHFNPDTHLNPRPRISEKYDGPHMLSIWNRNYQIISSQPRKKSPVKERPSLKNKEIIADFRVASQLRKRLRNVENCLESKTDHELSHLYFPESPSSKKSRSLAQPDETACITKDSVEVLASFLDDQVNDDDDDDDCSEGINNRSSRSNNDSNTTTTTDTDTTTGDITTTTTVTDTTTADTDHASVLVIDEGSQPRDFTSLKQSKMSVLDVPLERQDLGRVTPVLASKTLTPVLASKTLTPVLASKTLTPVLASKTLTPASQEETPVQPEPADTKPKLKPIHLNRFAVVKEEKRFDINALKVRSRYFHSPKEEEEEVKVKENITPKTSSSCLSQLFGAEPTNLKLPGDSRGVNTNAAAAADDDDDDGNNNNNNNHNTSLHDKTLSSPCAAETKKPRQQKTLSSLSAFSWGRHSSSYNNNNNNNKVSPPRLGTLPKGGQRECDMASKTAVTPQPSPATPQPMVTSVTPTTPTTTVTPVSYRQEALYNSQSSFCDASLENSCELFDSGIGCSPFVTDTDSPGMAPDTMGIETASQDTVFGFNSLLLCSQGSQSSGTPTGAAAFVKESTGDGKSVQTAAVVVAPQPKCRVSGLSKSSKRKSSCAAAAASKKLQGQQSIKDMFAKFAFTKGSKSYAM
ncbi:exonuclease 1-like [Argonauta hians]